MKYPPPPNTHTHTKTKQKNTHASSFVAVLALYGMLLVYVQSGCKSAIILSSLPAPKLTPNFQGLYVDKEYRGWSWGGGGGGGGYSSLFAT